MKTQSVTWPSTLNLTIGIAVVLFSAGGAAAISGLNQASAVSSARSGLDDHPTSPAAPAAIPVRGRLKCAECGVILSVRQIEAPDDSAGPGATNAVARGSADGTQKKSGRYYEFTILMADRSLRWANDENPAFWHIGERVIVIDGSKS